MSAALDFLGLVALDFLAALGLAPALGDGAVDEVELDFIFLAGWWMSKVWITIGISMAFMRHVNSNIIFLKRMGNFQLAHNCLASHFAR